MTYTAYDNNKSFITQVKLERNSVSSKWVDLTELVRSQDVDATNEEGTNVSEEFLEAMDTFKKSASHERSGICLRWMLGTYGEDSAVYLIAQMLPCGLHVIEANQTLRDDHARGMMAAKFPVNYDAFDNEMASGKNLIALS